MRIGLLGPITIDGRPFEAGRRERQLLILLVSRPGEPVSVDRIVDAMWGESPPSNPANAVQAAVSRLRRAITDLEALVDRFPLRERLWVRLIEAMYADGRQAEALRSYRRAASILAEQL